MRFEKYFDHTCLKPEATEADIAKLCNEAMRYDFASVCINPCYVKFSKKLIVNSKIMACSVVGFPLGANTMDVKIAEATNAVNNGADEIDVVINVGKLKDKQYDYIKEEINRVKQSIGDHVLKVIVETCLLDEDEKINICKIILDTNADYIKTSTGFGTPKDKNTLKGADEKDIKLFKNLIGNKKLKIKASGGINTYKDTDKMIKAGAERIGASKSVYIVKEILSSQ
ncbi:MAG: deoxyribose-phosphate aldolase [Candidatus Margulisiibacteriota bacterium]